MGAWLLILVAILTLLIFTGGWGLLIILAIIVGAVVLSKGRSDD